MNMSWKAAVVAAVVGLPNFASAAIATQPFDINDSGVVVGTVTSSLAQQGFIYSGGTYTLLNVPGALATQARAVSDAGVVAGDYWDSSGGHLFTYSDGVFAFPASGQSILVGGINDSGVMSGTYFDNVGSIGGAHGWLDQGGVISTYDDPNAFPGDPVLGSGATYGEGVNDLGEVVGYYYCCGYGSGPRGFLKIGGVLTDLLPPGADAARANDINDAGTIIGNYLQAGWHGFLYSGGIFTPIADPVASSYGVDWSGLNDHGAMVGTFEDAAGVHGLVFDDGHLTVLDAIHEPAPVPEPVQWLLMVMGLGLTGAILRRSRAHLRTTA